ncbi:MAG TPA: hypothetical protein VIQ55_07000 [Burkholderiales bacterium]|jgi:hypothetical protein
MARVPASERTRNALKDMLAGKTAADKSSLVRQAARLPQRQPANMLERLFGEERRRTKVIPHAFGERAVLKLMYASLIRASDTWKRIVITDFELRQLQQLREHLNERHVERTASPAVQSASRSRVSSKVRT